MITREAMMILKNQLVLTNNVNRSYDDKFAVSGAKIGDTLNVRKPPQYLGRSGQLLQIENAVEQSVPVTLTTQFGVDIQFSSADLALSIDDFSRRFLKPAVATIANKVDWDIGQLYKNVYWSTNVTAPGTTPTALLEYLKAGQKLNDAAAPLDDERYAVLNSDAHVALVNGLTSIFNPQREVSEQYRKGLMGQAAGFGFYLDQNIARHTCGSRDNTTPVTNGAPSGSSVVVSGLDASVTIKAGDVFTIADCFSVNPQNRQSTGNLMQFVVTQDTTADGAGAATLPIAPAIITSGAFQTCTAPLTSKALVFVGTASTGYAQNLAFHRDAFCLATADLPLPGGTDMASRVNDPDAGLSLRLVRQYNISNDQFPCRIELLYGVSALRPELACRIWSA
jgi:hypothetical protein